MRTALPIIGFVTFLLVWWAVASTAWAETPPRHQWIAHPRGVIEKLGRIAFADVEDLDKGDARILQSERKALSATIKRIGISVVCVVVLGLFIGFPMGLWTNGYLFVRGVLDACRSIPPIALLPIAVWMFPREHGPWMFGLLKIDDQMRIALVVFGCVPIMVSHIADAIGSSGKERLEYARQLGASRRFILRRILFYEVLPAVFVSVRTVVSFAVIIVIACEMAWGPQFGLGVQLQSAMTNGDAIATVYCYAGIAGGIGYFANQALRWLEGRVVTWI